MITEIQNNKIASVPATFTMPDKLLYPPLNTPDFEYWLSKNIKPEEIIGDRIYLPIIWTGYYKMNCDYGNNKKGIAILQDYLDTLDTSKKYFSICQLDDGILNDISHLDIKVFSMAGKPMDYCLPLLCQPHGKIESESRDIFASFIGRDTHPIRKEIFKLSGKPKYYISNGNHGMKEYCKILSRSVFALAPRGYGLSSFRIFEALEQGAIPIYLAAQEDFIIPHGIDFNSYGLLVKDTDVDKLPEILERLSEEDIKKKQEVGKFVYANYYTFQTCKDIILNNI